MKDSQEKITEFNSICTFGDPTYRRESETESQNAASMTFSAKDEVRCPRFQRGGKSLKSRCSVIRTLLCPTDRRFKKKKKSYFRW